MSLQDTTEIYFEKNGFMKIVWELSLYNFLVYLRFCLSSVKTTLKVDRTAIFLRTTKIALAQLCRFVIVAKK